MRKVLLSFLFAFVMICANAQVSYGTYVSFPNNSFAYSKTNPKLAFGKVNENHLLVLKYVDLKAYKTFDTTSQLLLKFGDEIVHVPISQIDTKVEKDFETQRIGSVMASYYITYTSFDIDDQIVKRIVDNKESISKIRVVFSNGDMEDFDIKEKYQPKLRDGLIESFNNVSKQDASRKQTLGDSESGF